MPKHTYDPLDYCRERYFVGDQLTICPERTISKEGNIWAIVYIRVVFLWVILKHMLLPLEIRHYLGYLLHEF